MLVIGLTGGIGSGKTTVAKLFSKKNITVIDTDELARDVTLPGTGALKKIVKKFGVSILLPNKTLNRARLRQIIFADQKQREWLEKLLHPLIRMHMQKQIERAQSPYCIAVIPLLLETIPNPLINRILVIDAYEEQQLQRAHKRDKLSVEAIHAVIKSQITRELRLSAADDVISNHGDLKDLTKQVDKLHQLYLSLALK